MAWRRRGEPVEHAVDGACDLRRGIEPHGDRRAQARGRRVGDDRPVADARTRQNRGVEDLHRLGGELKHQCLVVHHIAEHRPHRATPCHREVLEQASEELVEELAVRDEVTEADEAASHPEQAGKREVPEMQHVDREEREKLQQLLAAQRREERRERCSVVRRRDRDHAAYARRQSLHVERRRQRDLRRDEQARVEPSARVTDQMKRTGIVPRRRGDRLRDARGASRQRGRGGRVHDVDARVDARRGQLCREHPPHVPEVGNLPEVREPQEPRNQIDVGCTVHAPRPALP